MCHPIQEHAGTGDAPVDKYIPPPDYSASENLMAVPPGIFIDFACVTACEVQF